MNKNTKKICLLLSVLMILPLTVGCDNDDEGLTPKKISEITGTFYRTSVRDAQLMPNGEIEYLVFYGCSYDVFFAGEINVENGYFYIPNTGEFQKGQNRCPSQLSAKRIDIDFPIYGYKRSFPDDEDLDIRWNLCKHIFEHYVAEGLDRQPVYYMKLPIMYGEGFPYVIDINDNMEIMELTQSTLTMKADWVLDNPTPENKGLMTLGKWELGETVNFRANSDGVFESYSQVREYYFFILDRLIHYYPNPVEFSVLEYTDLMGIIWAEGKRPQPEDVRYWTIDIPQIRREIDEYITAHTSEAE